MLIGLWNVRTMLQVGKIFGNSFRNNKIWTEGGCVTGDKIEGTRRAEKEEIFHILQRKKKVWFRRYGFLRVERNKKKCATI